MKRLAILSVLYIYLETGLCIEESNISPVDAASDLSGDISTVWHPSVTKRNSAFKRLPAWSVYYGKRSSESPLELHGLGGSETENIDFDNIANKEMAGDSDSASDKTAYPALLYYFLEQRLHDGAEGNSYLDAEKRAIVKRLQPWMSTYGKRSDSLDTGFDTEAIDTDADITKDNLENLKQSQELTDNVYDMPSEFGIDDMKRTPGWHATYGKRIPGWTATYGKRSPSWLSTYGKRLAGWSATYGKRAPAWSITYGKRAPAWSITYGKRLPGWSATYGKRVPWGATYGKRVPWGATYGKRVPWGATYGKRVPWGATYGKRVPWGATYGKRSQSWNAFYGKRAPMWQAVYGKRDEDNASAENDSSHIIDNTDQTSDTGEKRSQAWSAFYGR